MTDALLDHAERSIAVGSKSFAAASRLFDADTRRSAVMLYAWCRHCDDVIDGQQLGFGQQPSDTPASRARLEQLLAATQALYAGAAPSEPAFAALGQVVAQHGIPQRYPLEHLAGFRMDVEQRRYQRFEDTLEYCYHVAGVVGVMMAMLMGVRDEQVLDHACDLGMAFQLTNIARDIVEDAGAGRVYLPEQWLAELGVAPDQLAAPRYRAAIAQLAQRLVMAAEPYYASAAQGLAALPLRSAWAIATARGVYRQIGVKVQARGAHAWDRRVSTNRLDKLRLVGLGGLQALGSRAITPQPRPSDLWTRPR